MVHGVPPAHFSPFWYPKISGDANLQVGGTSDGTEKEEQDEDEEYAASSIPATSVEWTIPGVQTDCGDGNGGEEHEEGANENYESTSAGETHDRGRLSSDLTEHGYYQAAGSSPGTEIVSEIV